MIKHIKSTDNIIYESIIAILKLILIICFIVIGVLIFSIYYLNTLGKLNTPIYYLDFRFISFYFPIQIYFIILSLCLLDFILLLFISKRVRGFFKK